MSSSKVAASAVSGISCATLLPALFHSRLLAVNRDCAALSSICHSLVAAGSSQPKTLASQRMLVVLIPLSFSWNQSCTVRRSIPTRLESICEIASARSSGVHGPAGNPSSLNGRPAPAAADRLNNSLKSLPSRGGGRNSFPFFINWLLAMTSFRFASLRILSCHRS